jgi:hypothetical protein
MMDAVRQQEAWARARLQHADATHFLHLHDDILFHTDDDEAYDKLKNVLTTPDEHGFHWQPVEASDKWIFWTRTELDNAALKAHTLDRLCPFLQQLDSPLWPNFINMRVHIVNAQHEHKTAVAE